MLQRNGHRRPEVVVITGASAGVGRATARAFGRQGARVGLLARGEDGLQAAKREVEIAGGKAIVIPTDMADDSQVNAAAEAVESRGYPEWVEVDAKALKGTFEARPQRSELPSTINESLVVELYSK